MSFPHPFRKTTGNTRDAWGYVFELTPAHPSRATMEEMKHEYDTVAADAYNRLCELNRPALTSSQGSRASGKAANDEPMCGRKDMYQQLKRNAHSDEALSKLWASVHEVPDWVSWDQIARGQDCFYRYGVSLILGLAFQSLIAGMGAARIAETLSRTGGFSTKVARHRLYETTQFVLQVTRSIEGIQPGGEGFAAAVRVRMLHAAVRQRIMNLAKQTPEYYDVTSLGVPINDLDSVATIVTFSASLIWIALPRQGIKMRPQEIEDFTALWRYVAYLLGTPTDPFKTPEDASRWMEVLTLYEIDPSPGSRTLTSNVISSLQDQPPAYHSREYLEVNARFLIGPKLADALGIGRPSIYYWTLMTIQCFLVMASTYFDRLIPYRDQRRIEKMRRAFWYIIVEGKIGLGGETMFEYKYKPEISKRTMMEGPSTGSDMRRKAREGSLWARMAQFCCTVALTFASMILLTMYIKREKVVLS